MACQNGTCSSPNSCNCSGTSYTIPSNAVYGDSTCRQPSEPCSEVTCAECVRNCHGEDKWCVKMPVTINDITTAVDFCIHQGERLDQMLQKLSLAQGSPTAYPYIVKNFYINSVTSTNIELLYFEFSEDITSMTLWVAANDSNEWQEITSFNVANPLVLNSFNLSIENVLISGSTYKLKLVTSVNGITYDPGSVILYITIP